MPHTRFYDPRRWTPLEAILALDAWLFELVNGANYGDTGDTIFRGITLLGDIRVFLPATFLATVVIVRARWWRALRYMCLVLGVCGAITMTTKAIVDRARPTAVGGLCGDDVQSATPKHDVVLRWSKPCTRSFPSGHTSMAFAWLVGLSLVFGGGTIRVLIAMGLGGLAGLSRIVLGVHYPLDTLFGALLGLACAFLAAKLLAPRPPPGGEKKHPEVL